MILEAKFGDDRLQQMAIICIFQSSQKRKCSAKVYLRPCQTLYYVKSVRIRSFSGLYSVRMRGNMDQKDSEYGHFPCNVYEFFANIVNVKQLFFGTPVIQLNLVPLTSESLQRHIQNLSKI